MATETQLNSPPPRKKRRLELIKTVTTSTPTSNDANEKVIIKTALAQHFAGEPKDLEPIVINVMQAVANIDKIKERMHHWKEMTFKNKMYMKEMFSNYCQLASQMIQLRKIAKKFNRKPITSPWKNFAIDFFHITRALTFCWPPKLEKNKPEYEQITKWFKAEKYLTQSQKLFETEFSSKFLSSTGIHIYKKQDVDLRDFLTTGNWFAKAIVKVKEIKPTLNGNQAIDWLLSKNKDAEKILLTIVKQEGHIPFHDVHLPAEMKQNCFVTITNKIVGDETTELQRKLQKLQELNEQMRKDHMQSVVELKNQHVEDLKENEKIIFSFKEKLFNFRVKYYELVQVEEKLRTEFIEIKRENLELKKANQCLVKKQVEAMTQNADLNKQLEQLEKAKKDLEARINKINEMFEY